MKCLIVLAVFVAVASAAQFPYKRAPQQYQPSKPAKRASSGSDRDAQVVRLDADINPDGTYGYSYETSNGISASEQGSAGGASGSFQFSSPEGQLVSIQYVADANGFQPQGDSIPTPPPVPDYIARSIAWNNAHPNEQ